MSGQLEAAARLYDEIAAEPLPNDLVSLIERDADKSKRPPKK